MVQSEVTIISNILKKLFQGLEKERGYFLSFCKTRKNPDTKSRHGYYKEREV